MDTKNSVNDAYPNVQILQASPEAYEKAARQSAMVRLL